jgi:hypothetical protein
MSQPNFEDLQMQQRLNFSSPRREGEGYRSLEKEKEEILEKLRVAQYCVTTYENEKDEFWAMLEEDKVKIQREKDQLLAE